MALSTKPHCRDRPPLGSPTSSGQAASKQLPATGLSSLLPALSGVGCSTTFTPYALRIDRQRAA